MTVITTLTKEQKELFPTYVEKWINIGLSTEPANREKGEDAIIKSYILAGLSPPKKIVWCGSPLSQGIARAIILQKYTDNFLGESVGESVWDCVGQSVGDSVWRSVGESVRDSVWDCVRESVANSVWESVRDSVGYSVWDPVVESVWDSVSGSVWESVGESVWDCVGQSVGESLSDSIWDSVGDSVRQSVGYSVQESVAKSVRESVYGQHLAPVLSFFDYYREVLHLVEETEKITGLMEIAKNVGWILPHRNICFASERHCLLNRDEKGKLHSLTGPAVMYPDGWSIYAVHGVRVKEYIIKNPEKISIDSITEEKNVEIRRVMIDQYDRELKGRYLKDSGAKLIHKDHFGELYIKELQNDEPILMVKVINSTQEPDSTFKEYFLRVPPHIKTAKEAVAWTFNVDEKNYNPLVET